MKIIFAYKQFGANILSNKSIFKKGATHGYQEKSGKEENS